MALPDIISSTSHMVDDCISIDSDSSFSASLNHASQLISSSMSAIKFVRCWLVHEPPGVEFTILWPFISENRFLWWKNFDSHVTCLTKEFAFFSNISIWPSEELNNCSFLTILVVGSLIYWLSLPNKVTWLNSNSPCFSISICCFNLKS